MFRETVTEVEREFFFARKALPKTYTGYLEYAESVKKLELSTVQSRKNFILKFIIAHPKKSSFSTVKKLTRQEIQDYTI